ncbi:hypothetical protein [Arthrobacter methylotrophus]|uniref:Uncharacterized protein n=1 Tax=Arthrobacter methylotrophus TaxID=121291 RepID=A0ABV5UR77_9MICC
MVIHVKLSDRQTAATDDPLRRSWFGFDPGATPAELWQNNRGDWSLLAERIAAERWAELNHGGRIVVVAELDGPAYEILTGTTPAKKALFGRVLPEGHPVREALFEKPVVYPPGSRNPSWYDAHPGRVAAGAGSSRRNGPGAAEGRCGPVSNRGRCPRID